jgi:large subunit ribosomal protein L4
MLNILGSVKAEKKALILMSEKDENVIKSASNLPGVETALVSTMNVYQILHHTSLIVTKSAVEKIEEVYA